MARASQPGPVRVATELVTHLREGVRQAAQSQVDSIEAPMVGTYPREKIR
jgi:hypothetical protein